MRTSKFYKPSKQTSASTSEDQSTPSPGCSSTRSPQRAHQWLHEPHSVCYYHRAVCEQGRRGSLAGLSPSPVKKKWCHLLPEALWKLFPRQQMAFDFSKTCYQSSAVFAFESEALGRQGQRRYLVTTYYEFGQRYLSMKGSRHFYEVVGEDSACRLYFDIEFKKEPNPSVDGVSSLEAFIQYVCYQLFIRYGLSCDRSSMLDLDSSSPSKFSRHLIFHLPSAAFKNNIHAGHFVRHCCDQLRSFKSQTDAGGDSLEVHRQHFPPPVTDKRVKNAPRCPDVSDLKRLFVLDDHGREGLLCDEAVYTRNRNFRLFLSSKLGKEVSLRVAKENRFRSAYSEDYARRRRSQRFNTLMDSLICNVSFETCSRVLEFLPAELSRQQKRLGTAARESDLEAGYLASPFPAVDSFITSTLTRGGVQGSIRRWTYFSQGKQIVYDIHGNRWCENIGRAHKSNNVMIVVDLVRGVHYQKCHDPECKRIDFRSNEKPLPAECLALSSWDSLPQDERQEDIDLDELLGSITDEELRQLEAEDSDPTGHTPPHMSASDQTSPGIKRSSTPSHNSEILTADTPARSRECDASLSDEGRVGMSCDTNSDSSSSLNDLMLKALEEYERSTESGGVTTCPDTQESEDHTSRTTPAAGTSADQELTETVLNMSVEEMNSFCEDIDHF